MIRRKWQRLLIQLLVIFWIIACLYVWWILNGALGIKYLPKLSYEFYIIVQNSSHRIWPYVWRQYIFVK